MKLDTQLKKAEHILKKYFGYDAFYPTQKQAIQSVLAGNDTFVLMPTGGGKSICFQIPALVLDGVTIVVSPLISLMKDQVDGLKANGIGAEYLNSSLDNEEENSIIKRLLNGEIKLLYVSAERLLASHFLAILKKLSIGLFAIDEAHCISAWGHDFRPDYTKLSFLKDLLPYVPIIALTATADQTTRTDIISQLGLTSPRQFVDSFDRPNIELAVMPGQKRLEKIKEFLSDKTNQSGIIYCLTRKQTENLVTKLQTFGINASSYHAGITSEKRSRIQKNFSLDKTQVICATIAFGMGIDKSNVRWVIHYNLPKNIEGYYQEIGRAGRDSAPAKALLFYTYADVETIKRFFIKSSQNSLQLEKLNRIKEYAEAVICRRQVLLRYFDEPYNKKCQNCDVCAHPYTTLDGTSITRAILETVQAMGQADTKNLVNALLAKSTKVTFASWHFYVAQLKNLGLLAIHFDHNHYLSITKSGQSVLDDDKRVKLTTLDAFIQRQEKDDTKIKKLSRKSAKDYYKNPLFESLRELRAQIASEDAVPAYIIFSDKTLLEMANEKPKNKTEMLRVSGVGEVKWEKYGERFLRVIHKTH